MLLTSRLKPLPPPPQALSAWGGDTCHNLDKNTLSIVHRETNDIIWFANYLNL